MSKNSWRINSWRNFSITQQPDWPDEKLFEEIISRLQKLPSLVFSGETRKLKKKIAKVNDGHNFILQVGNCAESFGDCNGPKIHNFLRIFLQMSMVIEFFTNKNMVKIGRIAGQYAKPRSSDTEIVNGIILPSYKGDIINKNSPTFKARTPDPNNLLEGYFRSAATLNLIRAFIQGGYSDISNITDWKEHFFSKEVSMLKNYKGFEQQITTSLNRKDISKKIGKDQIFTSHEGLLLDYEQAFTRIDTTHGGYYDTTAHFIWIGNRTRQMESAHIEFIRGIGNPVGLKIGPDYEIEELVKIFRKVNPENINGRLVLISRMGQNNILTKLRPIIKAVKKNNLNVTWVCDPMHGNTFNHNNYKVRSFENIVDEIRNFFMVCNVEGVVPGGLHLEITDENVTECTGGINGATLSNLSENYLSKVDPRLNAAQALEIAFIVSELI